MISLLAPQMVTYVGGEVYPKYPLLT